MSFAPEPWQRTGANPAASCSLCHSPLSRTPLHGSIPRPRVSLVCLVVSIGGPHDPPFTSPRPSPSSCGRHTLSVGKTRYRGLPMVHMCRERCQGRDAFHPPPQCWEGWSAAWGAELPIFPLPCETARSRAPFISSNGWPWWLIALVGNPNGTGRVTRKA